MTMYFDYADRGEKLSQPQPRALGTVSLHVGRAGAGLSIAFHLILVQLSAASTGQCRIESNRLV